VKDQFAAPGAASTTKQYLQSQQTGRLEAKMKCPVRPGLIVVRTQKK